MLIKSPCEKGPLLRILLSLQAFPSFADSAKIWKEKDKYESTSSEVSQHCVGCQSMMAPVSNGARQGTDEVQELCVRWMCLLSSSSQTLQNGCHGAPGYCGKTGLLAWLPESPVEYILRAWSSVCPMCKDWKKSEGCGPLINLGEILKIHQEEWTFLLTSLFSWWQIFLCFR